MSVFNVRGCQGCAYFSCWDENITFLKCVREILFPINLLFAEVAKQLKIVIQAHPTHEREKNQSFILIWIIYSQENVLCNLSVLFFTLSFMVSCIVIIDIETASWNVCVVPETWDDWPVIHNALYVCHGNGWQGTRHCLAACPALYWIQLILQSRKCLQHSTVVLQVNITHHTAPFKKQVSYLHVCLLTHCWATHVLHETCETCSNHGSATL